MSKTGSSGIKGAWPGHSHFQLTIIHQSVNNMCLSTALIDKMGLLVSKNQFSLFAHVNRYRIVMLGIRRRIRCFLLAVGAGPRNNFFKGVTV